jgi:hypothetical protein
MPLERAYRVAPDEDLGGWFESDGEMTVYMIDGEIELTLENEGSWRLGAGEAISHPADIRHRWAVVGDGAARILLSVAHAHPAAGPFRCRRLTAKPVTRFMMQPTITLCASYYDGWLVWATACRAIGGTSGAL